MAVRGGVGVVDERRPTAGTDMRSASSWVLDLQVEHVMCANLVDFFFSFVAFLDSSFQFFFFSVLFS